MKEILQMCRLHFYVICFMIPFKEKNLHNIFLKQNHQKHTSFRRRKIFFKFSFNWVIDILMINRVVISPSHLWLQILAKLWEQEQKPKGFFFYRVDYMQVFQNCSWATFIKSSFGLKPSDDMCQTGYSP